MKRNMKTWKEEVIAAKCKKAMPILSFPSVQLMGVTVRELVSSSELQARGMKLVADRTPSLASLSLMDQIGTSIDTVAGAAEELEKLAQRLEETMSVFNV